MSTRNADLTLAFLVNSLAAASRASALITKYRMEGRSGPSNEEMAGLQLDDDAARAQLVASIEAGKAAG